MTMRYFNLARCLWALGTLVLTFAAVHPASSAEDATIKAFVVWQGKGHLFQTDVDEATFVGVLAGILYVETEKGPIAMGAMTCPATINLKLADGTQLGSGRCVIVADDGARVFAEIDCEGVHLVGCNGEFTLVGGDGRFEGIQGGGPVTIRSTVGTMSKSAMGSMEETATGILYLPAVHYTIP